MEVEKFFANTARCLKTVPDVPIWNINNKC